MCVCGGCLRSMIVSNIYDLINACKLALKTAFDMILGDDLAAGLPA